MIFCLSQYILVITTCLQETLAEINAKEKEVHHAVGNDGNTDEQENVELASGNELVDNDVEDIVVEHPTPNLVREAPKETSIEPRPTPSKSKLLTISLTYSQIT